MKKGLEKLPSNAVNAINIKASFQKKMKSVDMEMEIRLKCKNSSSPPFVRENLIIKSRRKNVLNKIVQN